MSMSRPWRMHRCPSALVWLEPSCSPAGTLAEKTVKRRDSGEPGADRTCAYNGIRVAPSFRNPSHTVPSTGIR